MIFTLTDRSYNVLDAYESEDYLIGSYIGSIIKTLDIEVLVTSSNADKWIEGHYIMCESEDGYKHWFTIYDAEDSFNSDFKNLKCYSGTIDIVAEDANPIAKPAIAQPFTYYFEKIFFDTGVKIGINEISGLTRRLEFTSENASNVEMLQYVLNGFDNAEADLAVEFSGSVPTGVILNVFKRIGEVEPQTLLSDEDDSLTSLDRTGSISDLATCLNPIGESEDDPDNPITLVGKYYEELDENGNILYYSPKDSPRVFSLRARQQFYVQLPGKANGEFDGYINRRYSSQASTQDSLWAQSLAQLKKIDSPNVTYEAKGHINCRIGDTIQIVSNEMRPPVMISARVLEYKFNDDDPSLNEYTFGNYEQLESNMDELAKLMEEIKKSIIIITSQTVDYALSDDGAVPPTNWSESYIPPTIGQWLWTRTVTNLSNGDQTVGYSVSRIGEDGKQGQPGEDGHTPIKGTDYFDGQDGQDGKSSYLHVRYSQNSNGNPMTTDPTNAKYIGVATTETSTAPTGYASYKWTLFSRDGNPGEPGPDGRTSYLHIKYSDDGGLIFTANSGETVGAWIGTYVDFKQDDSTDVNSYTWNKVKGKDGTPGDRVFKRYSANPDGSNMTEEPQSDTKYSGDLIVPGELYGSTLDGLEIGGRNLLLDSSMERSGARVDDYLDYGLRKDIFIPLIDQSITISFYGKSDDAINQYTDVYFRDSSLGGSSVMSSTPFVLTNEYQRFSYTKILSDTLETYAPNNLQIRFRTNQYVPGGRKNTGKISIKNVQIEKGNKATDWSPAPEDLINDYTKYKWTLIKGEDGKDGTNGTPGQNAITGYLTNEALAVTASPTGVVSSFAGANGYFRIMDGNTQATSGMTFSKVNEVGMTSTINSTGYYAVTAMSADFGSVTYRAVYKGITVEKILMIVKNKQGTAGATGSAGKGISSTVVTYQASTSGTTVPTGTWTTGIPTVAANQYLWTRTVITYTDSTTTTSYSIGKMGANGATGNTGSTGATGRGISSTAVTYQASTSGTTVPTGTWVSSPPAVAANSFLWTRTILTYTSGTPATTTSYSIGKMGANGATGPKGDPTGITAAATAPTNPYVGMLWRNTGTAGGRINGVTYRWTGSTWEIFLFHADNISATNLAAITANLGNITAGTLSGSGTNGSIDLNLNTGKISTMSSSPSETSTLDIFGGRLISKVARSGGSIYTEATVGDAAVALRAIDSGTLVHSTTLIPQGFTNYADGSTRLISFSREGMILQPSTANTGNDKNSGLELKGVISYIDFHNSPTSTADFGARIVFGHPTYGPNRLVLLAPNDDVQVQTLGHLHVKNVAGTGYRSVKATSFDTQSAYSVKKDFQQINNDYLLNEIMSTDILSYLYKDAEQETRTIGFVINDGGSPFKTSKLLPNADGRSFSLTTAVGMAFGAIKALNKRLEELEHVAI